MNSRTPSVTPSYRDCFSAQFGALGRSGQRRLQRASVLVVGTGGLGTNISMVLAMAGVGTIVLVDPQRVEAGNFNRYPFARPTDIGKPKVDVVAGFFEGRPHLTAIPIVGRAEDLQRLRIARDVTLVVSASNTVPSRLAVARLAARRRLAHVSAALTDGRKGRGGFVVAWLPERPDLACPACFLTPRVRLDRGESILATVAAVVGATAAALAVQLLAADDRAAVVDAANCTSIDVDRRTTESYRVLRRHDCEACRRRVNRRGNR